MVKNLLMISICILILSACGETEYIERTGKIITKEYTPAKTETEKTFRFFGKTSMLVTNIRVIPEKYVLKVSYVVEKEREIEVQKRNMKSLILGKL
ncbi:hypothetical protein [uncultured Fusobacterium sp.]|uniref:hypothetical protein n=1 Tax=uncultured Fusobacterium sp. TaxID=159267 RepID=UPI0025F3F50F|nr:hypothetical protein [uncultured Fusobacterium sp.]